MEEKEGRYIKKGGELMKLLIPEFDLKGQWRTNPVDYYDEFEFTRRPGERMRFSEQGLSLKIGMKMGW